MFSGVGDYQDGKAAKLEVDAVSLFNAPYSAETVSCASALRLLVMVIV